MDVKYEAQYQTVHTARNLVFNEKIREMRAEGKTVHNFAFGQNPFPVPEVGQEALKKHVGENLYEAVQGLLPLREKIVEQHGVQHFDASRVLVGPGCKELSWLMMHVIKMPVYLVSPTWVTYESQVEAANKEFHYIKSGFDSDWKITPEEFKKSISKASTPTGGLLVLVNPCNPSGQSYSKRELEEIATVAREHNIIVLSDEIYAFLSFDVLPSEHLISMAEVYPEGTIVGSGISKWASCGGWRLGYHMFPKELAPLMTRIKAACSWSYSCVASPIQYAAIELLQKEGINKESDYLRKCSIIFCAVATYTANSLRKVGVKVHDATSGFYLMPVFENCRSDDIQNGTALADAILAEGQVAMVECGPCFGRDASELSTRLCYIDFDGKLALNNLNLAKEDGLTARQYVEKFDCASQDFMELVAPNMVRAVAALTGWVEARSNK